jgi:phosphonate transport system ATP-binding protein
MQTALSYKNNRFAFWGKNGSGKSTFLRCCLRLLEPDQGTIHLLDHDLTSMTSRQLRQIRSQVGFIFQRHNLCTRLSTLSNVIHGCQARKRGIQTWYQSFARKQDREEAMYCLHRVGLDHVANRRVDRLSGGESQRVAIARALMQKTQTDSCG